MIDLQSILEGRAAYAAKYKALYDPKAASILSQEYYAQVYKELYQEDYSAAPKFSNMDIVKRHIDADLSIFVISLLKTAQMANPLFAQGADLDRLLKLLVDRKVNVPAKCLFEIQTSSQPYPYVIAAGAKLKNSSGDILFETLQDTTITGDRSSMYFTATTPGNAFNGLSSATGLQLSVRGGTTDEAIATYQIYTSAGGVDYQSDAELLLDYYAALSYNNAGSKFQYRSRIKSLFAEVTDVYVKDVDELSKGNVNIFLSLVGGKSYSDSYLDLVKRTVYNRSPVTDNIIINYATPVNIDLSTTVVTSSSILSLTEKNAIISAINLYFSQNIIGKPVYRSQLISIISGVNAKIVYVSIGIPEVTILGETSFANPDYGTGVTFNTL